jgi:NAD(P)-dependent dehydrogenase (short-subunit alcohol dehydrogenase family)
MGAKFGAKSTTEEVRAGVDLKGKRILVTGVSAGLGVETARALVTHGANVVGAARDLEKRTGPHRKSVRPRRRRVRVSRWSSSTLPA